MKFVFAIIQWISQYVLTNLSRLIIKTQVRLRVEGLERMPRSGPVLIVAHHYHHFYDGCVLLAVSPRKLHIFVALDWIQKPLARRLMEGLCWLAEWLVVLRTERLQTQESQSIYVQKEVKRYLFRAITSAVRLLRRHEVVVIFPEAYPNIDPVANQKTAHNFLPFRAGFIRLVEMAERDKQTQVAVVPAGFCYSELNGRWHVTLRLGEPLYSRDFATSQELARHIEEQVQELSHASQKQQIM